MSELRVVRDGGTCTVIAAGYRLRLQDGEPYAVLTDPHGEPWSRLSLLASLDRSDVPDESYDLGAVRIGEGAAAVDVELSAATSAWDAKTVRLRCYPDRLEYSASVTGAGTLGVVRLFGGRALLPSGACGLFRSSTGFASVFDPTPTQPVQVVRPAATAATLGVVGDASAGRLHGIFAPPPLCLVLGRTAAVDATSVPDGDWLALGVVAGIDALRFTELRYHAEDDGFLLELDYDAHTTVAGEFRTPTLMLRPAADPWQALAAYRADHLARGYVPDDPPAPADWWTEPIFCGWGAQCAEATAAGGSAADLARQEHYDRWLGELAAHDVVPGTVIVDDRWQAAYGAAEPDPARWPDLRGWIAERHAAGQRVLLWWKAWDPEGLPADECICAPSGTPVAADPGNPAYLVRLREIVTRLLRPDGFGADGFKIDFTQRSPVGSSLRRTGAVPDAPWGIAALHRLLETIYTAAKAAKPDALIITHTAHPAFADVTDMLRLNDLVETDPTGARVPPAAQLAFRHAVASRALPRHLIDTDQWPISDRADWRAYVTAQARLGVPSLYYVDRLHPAGGSAGAQLRDADLALVADSWRRYRASRQVPA